jgi:hypothetical protein
MERTVMNRNQLITTVDDQRGECAILYVRFIFETLNCIYKWTVDYHVTSMMLFKMAWDCNK